MKTTLICTAVLALATSFSALAKEPTATCIDSLARDSNLTVIADKVALAHSNQAASVRVLDRVANEEERAAVALWLEKRQECFEAGAKQRRAVSKPQEIALVRSVFVFQQRLVSDLQGGRLTYADFNKRRLELVEAAGQEI
jgi:ectoine hydroxylase-related dioxygenase (phytanoyl-CoA dioxygenase family)